MNRIFVIFLTIFILTSSATSAQLRQHVLRVADYSALHVKGPVGIEIRNVPDSAGMISITATDAAYKAVTKIHNDRSLYISAEPDAADVIMNGLRSLIVYIPRRLDTFNLVVNSGATVNGGDIVCSFLYISMTGRGNVNLINPIDASSINCSVTGNSRLSLPALRATNLSVTLRGTGHVILGGTATATTSLVLKGTGDIDISHLKSGSLKETSFGDGKIIR